MGIQCLLYEQNHYLQNDLIIEMPRQRRQVNRYGKQDAAVNISDLDTSGSDDDDDVGGNSKGKRNKKRGRQNGDDASNGDMGENYSRNDCFNVEKCLLVYGLDLVIVVFFNLK